MATLKCKMCGGELNIVAGLTICECEYCGSKQTIPNTDDEKRLKLYERANRLRFDCEFDKAAGVYETIVADYQDEAEAYWGLVLCKYGIEYVDDPATNKKIPTCHRSSFDSVMDDSNFDLVMENADTVARGVYREEAKRIEEIRKGIIEVSSTEDPYDIFICYKETADDGQRTIDSVIAQDVYDALTEKGYRVFFSRITLEDKLGQEYEPYIFAALNSAKIMLAFGTTYDYYNAVWVKNEWSRFLQLIASGQKKTLIPCYKDIDAYDMPKEFKHLQAQDMGKVGAIQDLVRGIDKLLRKESKTEKTPSNAGITMAVDPMQLIKRGYMALEDGEWDKADEFFENALFQDAENSEAYFGKWLSKLHLSKNSELVDFYIHRYMDVKAESKEACPAEKEHIAEVISQYKVDEYLTEETIRTLYRYNRSFTSCLNGRKEQKRKTLEEIHSEKLYQRAKQYAENETADRLNEIEFAISSALDKIIQDAAKEDETALVNIKEGYAALIQEADGKTKELFEKAVKRRNDDYQSYIDAFEKTESLNDYQSVKNNFAKLRGYEESGEYIIKCDEEIKRINKEKEEEQKRQLEEKKNRRKERLRKTRKLSIIILGIIVAGIIATLLLRSIACNIKYKKANTFFDNKDYISAKDLFEELGDYSDSAEMIKKCNYNRASIYYDDEDYTSAKTLFEELGDYADAPEKLTKCNKYINYQTGLELLNKGECEKAYDCFSDAEDTVEDAREYKEYCDFFITMNNTLCLNLTEYIPQIENMKQIAPKEILYSACKGFEMLKSLECTCWEARYKGGFKEFNSNKESYREYISRLDAPDSYIIEDRIEFQQGGRVFYTTKEYVGTSFETVQEFLGEVYWCEGNLYIIEDYNHDDYASGEVKPEGKYCFTIKNDDEASWGSIAFKKTKE